MSTVLITGASRGIGRAAALLFGKNGWNVAVNYRTNEAAAQSLKEELEAMGVKCLPVQADVADAVQVRRMISMVEYTFGGIDVLVNNAGIAQQKLFTQLTEEDWDRMFDVHVKGTFHCTQAVLPLMIGAGKGSIVNVSSMWGQVGGACEVHYSAAKAGLIGMTKALAKEVGPSGIRVNCVTPGVIRTEMNSKLSNEDMEALKNDTPLGKIGEPTEIASVLLYLSSENASFITGQIIGVNGGMII